MNTVGFFSKIRERRLFQIVVSYLAAGWIFLQVTDQLVNRGVAGQILYNIVLLAYVCGIPAALLIGWYHGEKGEQHAPRSEIVMLTIILGVFLTLSSLSIAKYRTERMTVVAAQREAGTDLRKIAVLYFRDHSTGGEYQHVADGITESLIDELTRVPALDVVTRNGSARFRGSEVSRDSIGRALNVGTLVDGAVEKNGDRLRITVRLFDAYSGSEFRSTTIDESAEQVLEAQQRVVEEVARLLRGWLGEEVKVRQSGQRISNGQAWTLYQRAERSRKDAEAALHSDMKMAQAAWERADSLAAQAEVLARDWPEPIVLRGNVAYRRSRLAHDREQILSFADAAIAHADRALRLASTNARALELRGTTRYWKYITTRTATPADATKLLASARTDLEEAVRIQPLLASAHSTLSHLLYREDVSSAVLAARRAYEADAYLDVAPDVLFRLISGNYDIENLDQVQQWCDEAATRFPRDYRFAECQLLLMTTRQVEPDIPRAWSLLARMDSLAPHRERAYRRALGTLLVGGTIARASPTGGGRPALADSARAVLNQARALMTPEAVPGTELHPQTAYTYTLLGDNATAIQLLRQHAAANPHYSFEHHWWWRELRGAPEFRTLLVQSTQGTTAKADRPRH